MPFKDFDVLIKGLDDMFSIWMQITSGNFIITDAKLVITKCQILLTFRAHLVFFGGGAGNVIIISSAYFFLRHGLCVNVH